jgi:hypothetical protein
MSVVLGDGIPVEQRSEFINKLFTGMPESNPGELRVKVFRFGRYVAFAFIIVTDAKESSTERLGIKLALGFLIHESAHFSNGNIPACLMDILVDQVNLEFDTDVPSMGAEKIVEFYVKDRRGEDVMRRLNSRFRDAVRISKAAREGFTNSFWYRVRQSWRVLTPRRGQQPSMLIVFEPDVRKVFDSSFRSLAFEFLARSNRAPTIARLGDGDMLSRDISIIRLGFSGDWFNLKRCKLVTTSTGRYIALYGRDAS